ncbi:MAG: PhnD/SsuA/transferrin family substrate-binding protein [Rhodobacter sp.]|nr:PhnD/SsuA/transferrin family substrate-binding protein [Rhodobacter sp.]
MIAGLPMYDRPETAGAHDAYWQAIRDALRDRNIAAPDGLSRGIDPWTLWRRNDLVLAQTCGLPYRARLHGKVTLLGTPDFGVPDCPPGYYRSVIVVRAEDPRIAVSDLSGAKLAYNDPLSQSGWAAVRALGLPFSEKIRTGSHRQSARAVAAGRADLAGIDAVTWRSMGVHDPDLAGALRVLARTPPTPGLPYICAPGFDARGIAAAIDEALDGLNASVRDVLGLRGLVRIPPETYLEQPIPDAP